jgi:hypothetical protein
MTNNLIFDKRHLSISGSHTGPVRALKVSLAVFAALSLVLSTGIHAQAAPLEVSAPVKPVTFQCARAAATCGKWIEVNLTRQRLIAHYGAKPVFSTLISSGIAKYPTVTGVFKVYTKLRSDRMTGGTGRDHYDLPNVPHVMYFYGGYAIHGTYWHNNFGRPMSHGCVNTSRSAASWLFNWTPRGTPVWVHY